MHRSARTLRKHMRGGLLPLLVCVCVVFLVCVSFVELASLTVFRGEISSVQELRLCATELRPVSKPKGVVLALQACTTPAHKRNMKRAFELNFLLKKWLQLNIDKTQYPIL